MITRDKAIEILERHGVAPEEAGEFTIDANGAFTIPSAYSSFDDQVGKKDEYEMMEVLGWLGYCCLAC